MWERSRGLTECKGRNIQSVVWRSQSHNQGIVQLVCVFCNDEEEQGPPRESTWPYEKREENRIF